MPMHDVLSGERIICSVKYCTIIDNTTRAKVTMLIYRSEGSKGIDCWVLGASELLTRPVGLTRGILDRF
jgi:hypothetical protein